MLIDQQHYRSIWYDEAQRAAFIFDQTLLPHRFHTIALRTLDDFCQAIIEMKVRGAPLIGATAAYGLALSLRHSAKDIESTYQRLLATRPTAINLRWALDKVRKAVHDNPQLTAFVAALTACHQLCDDDVDTCSRIGNHGLHMIEQLILPKKKAGDVVHILTHCNAGWLATVDWGTAVAPIYKAHQKGIPVHVWVDETRPRNQGASLTAWELLHAGIPHTVIPDNTGGHLMQHGMVDLCIVGSDRTTAHGDVCNKIGTYLKALAAHANHVPFYVALPVSTIDWTINDGCREIPIEERSSDEVTHITGRDHFGNIVTVNITPDGSPAANYAFDVTPAALVSGLITEHGIFPASAAGLDVLRKKISL
jgi:methylthioribose-1-phosphate isomerase